jgi:hypothetical protein
MQNFKTPLSTDDRRFAHRIGRVMLIAYSSAALLLTAWVMAHIASKHQTTADSPIEIGTKSATSIRALSLR